MNTRITFYLDFYPQSLSLSAAAAAAASPPVFHSITKVIFTSSSADRARELRHVGLNILWLGLSSAFMRTHAGRHVCVAGPGRYILLIYEIF